MKAMDRQQEIQEAPMNEAPGDQIHYAISCFKLGH
jgi:hypothetical protein